MATSSLKNEPGMLFGVDAYERLEGIGTEVADWHAKFTLYKVKTTKIWSLRLKTPHPPPPHPTHSHLSLGLSLETF